MSSDIVYYTIAVDPKGNEALKYADSIDQLNKDMESCGLTRLEGAQVLEIDTPSDDLTVFLERFEHSVSAEADAQKELQLAYNHNCVGDLIESADELAQARSAVFHAKADILFWVCYHPEAAAVPATNLLNQLKDAVLGAAAWWNVADDPGQLISLIKLETGDIELNHLIEYLKNSPPVNVPEYALSASADDDEDDEDDEDGDE